MSTETITVLMPVYNPQAEWFEMAVRSILEQTYGHFELWLLDDGCEAEAKALLEAWVRRDSRIRVVANEHNRGLTYTLNRGLRLATTRLVARMDADDEAHPERFAKQMAFMHDNPDICVLGTGAVELQNGAPFGGMMPASYGAILSSMLWNACVIHPSVMMDRKSVLAAGGYPDVRYAEDYALWCRLLYKEGRQICNLPDVLLKYRTQAKRRPEYERRQKVAAATVKRQALEYLNLDPALLSVIAPDSATEALGWDEFRDGAARIGELILARGGDVVTWQRCCVKARRRMIRSQDNVMSQLVMWIRHALSRY